VTAWEAVKKYFWLVHLVFLTLAAYLSAGSVSSILHRRLDAVPTIDVSRIQVKAESNARSLAFYQAINDRNLFDSTAVPSEDDGSGEGGEASSGDVTLIGTVAAIPMENSLAICQNKSTAAVEIYRVGRKIGSATLVRVGRGYAVLERNGREERLVLPELKGEGGGQIASIGNRGPTPGITQQGDNSYRVDPEKVTEALGDMSKLMTEARIVPHMKDGKIDGFKVYNIKSDSLFKQIGLTNGDVIHSVNGMELSGPEQGLQIFEALKSERNINIDLTRRGARQTLNYTIR
jgi:general secretion pathway protein C